MSSNSESNSGSNSDTVSNVSSGTISSNISNSSSNESHKPVIKPTSLEAAKKRRIVRLPQKKVTFNNKPGQTEEIAVTAAQQSGQETTVQQSSVVQDETVQETVKTDPIQLTEEPQADSEISVDNFPEQLNIFGDLYSTKDRDGVMNTGPQTLYQFLKNYGLDSTYGDDYKRVLEAFARVFGSEAKIRPDDLTCQTQDFSYIERALRVRLGTIGAYIYSVGPDSPRGLHYREVSNSIKRFLKLKANLQKCPEAPPAIAAPSTAPSVTADMPQDVLQILKDVHKYLMEIKDNSEKIYSYLTNEKYSSQAIEKTLENKPVKQLIGILLALNNIKSRHINTVPIGKEPSTRTMIELTQLIKSQQSNIGELIADNKKKEQLIKELQSKKQVLTAPLQAVTQLKNAQVDASKLNKALESNTLLKEQYEQQLQNVNKTIDTLNTTITTSEAPKQSIGSRIKGFFERRPSIPQSDITPIKDLSDHTPLSSADFLKEIQTQIPESSSQLRQQSLKPYTPGARSGFARTDNKKESKVPDLQTLAELTESAPRRTDESEGLIPMQQKEGVLNKTMRTARRLKSAITPSIPSRYSLFGKNNTIQTNEQLSPEVTKQAVGLFNKYKSNPITRQTKKNPIANQTKNKQSSTYMPLGTSTTIQPLPLSNHSQNPSDEENNPFNTTDSFGKPTPSTQTTIMNKLNSYIVEIESPFSKNSNIEKNKEELSQLIRQIITNPFSNEEEKSKAIKIKQEYFPNMEIIPVLPSEVTNQNNSTVTNNTIIQTNTQLSPEITTQPVDVDNSSLITNQPALTPFQLLPNTSIKQIVKQPMQNKTRRLNNKNINEIKQYTKYITQSANKKTTKRKKNIADNELYRSTRNIQNILNNANTSNITNINTQKEIIKAFEYLRDYSSTNTDKQKYQEKINALKGIIKKKSIVNKIKNKYTQLLPSITKNKNSN